MWLSNIPGEGQGELAEPRTLHSTSGPCGEAVGARRAGRAPGSSFFRRINKACAAPSSAAFLDDPR